MARPKASQTVLVTILLTCLIWSTNSGEAKMGLRSQNNNENGNEMKETIDGHILVEQENSGKSNIT